MSDLFLLWANATLVLTGFMLWLIPRLTTQRRWTLIGPYAVMQLTFLLYCALGPINRYLSTDLMVIGIDLKDSMGAAAVAAALAYLSFNLGYVLCRREVRPNLILSDGNHYHIGNLALGVYMLAFLFTFTAVGFNLTSIYNVFGSSFNNSEGISLGGIQNYLYLSMSAMIAPVVLLLLLPAPVWLFWSMLLSLNAVAIYVTTGFRIRVALLFLAAALAVYARQTLVRNGKFPLVRILQISVVGILLISAMSVARKYGQGVDRLAISSAKSEDFISGFFKDTSIFYMGGRVVTLFAENEERSHTYFETVKATAIRAIPSQIYGEKPAPATLTAVQDAMGGTSAIIASGFAVPFYIEYFIMFGWPGVIILSALLGFVCATIENRFRGNVTLYHALFHIMVSAYMFMYFHRGYLPQQADFFFFIVALPMLLLFPFRRSIA